MLRKTFCSIVLELIKNASAIPLCPSSVREISCFYFFVGLAHISIKAYLKARSHVIVVAGILLINDNFHKYIMKTHTEREESLNLDHTQNVVLFDLYANARDPFAMWQHCLPKVYIQHKIFRYITAKTTCS